MSRLKRICLVKPVSKITLVKGNNLSTRLNVDVYTGRQFLTLLHRYSIRITRLPTIFNAIFVATTCCTTLNRLQIPTMFNVVATN